MTRFLLIFTLLTLAVPTTTEPSAQSGGTTSTPVPTDPQPILTTTTSVPIQPEPYDLGSGATQEAAPEATPVVGSTAPSSGAQEDEEYSEHDERARLGRCKLSTQKPPTCFVGRHCIDGGQFVNHTNFVVLNSTVLKQMARRGSDDPFTEQIEECDLGATFKKQLVGFYLEYHTAAKYEHIPLVIETNTTRRYIQKVDGNLACRPFCEVTEAEMDLSRVGGVVYSCWRATIMFHRVKKRVDLSTCFGKRPGLCFVGDGCFDGNNFDAHEAIIWLSQGRKLRFPEKRATWVGCNVAAILRGKRGPAGEDRHSLEYHTTPDNHRLIFTRYTTGPPRVGRRIYIKDGNVQCNPACEFTRTEGESGDEFFSGEIHFKDMSFAEAEEHQKNPLRIHVDDENETKPEPESNIAMILGVCAAVLILGIAAVVIVVKVIQRSQEKKNKRRLAAIEAAAKKHDLSRKGADKSREDERLIAKTPPMVEGPSSDPPVSESAKNRDDDF